MQKDMGKMGISEEMGAESAVEHHQRNRGSGMDDNASSTVSLDLFSYLPEDIP